MTVAATASRKVISGSGWSNPLSFPDLYIESASHIEVWADDTLLSLGVDYTVAGVQDADGFEVTITDEEMAPDAFVLYHRPPLTQGSDLSGGGVFGLAYTAALDAIVRRMQSLEDRVNRSFKAGLTTALDADEPIVPAAEDGKFLGWAGAVLANVDILSNGDLTIVDNNDLSLFGDSVALRQNVYAAIATAIAGAQPADADLTAIAALSTTAYGRALLTLADLAALKTLLSLAAADISGLGSSATRNVATFGEYNSATATRALGSESVWADLAVLTDDTTIAVDFNNGYSFGGASNAALALGGDRALGAPSNARNGKTGILWFTASGSTRILTLHANWNLRNGVETGPYSITTSQALGVAYICRGTTVIVLDIIRIG